MTSEETLSAVALPDELEVVIERLRPKHLADEPLARAVVSDDHMERRRAVSAYLVENNALKSEAVTALSQAHSTIAALRAEVEHWRGEARRLLKSGQEALDAAETAEAEVKRITEEKEALREALEPFADFGEYLELETEGFANADELHLVVEDTGFRLEKFYVGAFRRARAALNSREKAE